MTNRKRSRPTTVLASLAAACCWPMPITAATTPIDPFSWKLPASTKEDLTNNKKKNPRNHEDTSWWNMNDDGGSDDGNETESTSDDDDEFQNKKAPLIDDPVTLETSSIAYSTVPGSNKADTSSKRTHSERSKQKDNHNLNSASYQSMKTLDRLQQMLDDTDYITKPRPNLPLPSASRRLSATSVPSVPLQSTTTTTTTTKAPTTQHRNDDDSLWTSKDRSKYKKQQRKMINQAQNGFSEQMRQQQQIHESSVRMAPTSSSRHPSYDTPSHRPPPPPPISDEDLSEESEDALGYTLPNLPVYFSDAEGDSETEVETAVPPPSESNMYGYPTSTSHRPNSGLEQHHSGYSSHPYQHPQKMHAYPNDQYTYPSQHAGPHQGYQRSATGMHPPSSYPNHGYNIPQWNQHYQYPQQWSSPVGGNDPAQGNRPSPPTPHTQFQDPRQPSAATTLVTSSTERELRSTVSTT